MPSPYAPCLVGTCMSLSCRAPGSASRLKKLSLIFMARHQASCQAMIPNVRKCFAVVLRQTNSRYSDIINPDMVARANTSLPAADVLERAEHSGGLFHWLPVC